MKFFYPLATLLFLFAGAAFSQDEISKPIFIKAAYFDVSPPLRDMVNMAPEKVDVTWKDGIVKNNFNVFQETDNIPEGPISDAAAQFYFGSILTDTTIQNFEGVAAHGYLPPDTDGDVGPSHYFQVVNVKYSIFDKTGVKLIGPNLNKTIFNGFPGPWQNSNDGDAVVLYDENADRWLFSQFALPNYPNGPFYELVAISQTNDPTGTWYRYAFTFSDMPDYPKLSVWQDGYYMTIRRFASGSGNWLGPAAIAMDRTKMIAGDPSAGMVMFNMPSSVEGPLPLDCDSEFPPAGTPCYVGCLYDGSPDQIRLYEFDVDWTTPTNSTFALTTQIPVSSFTIFPSSQSNVVPQKNTNAKLDVFSRRVLMFRLPFRVYQDHWSIAACATVKMSAGHAGIRWMELRNTGSGWSLYQEGTYSPDDNWRWMGSIAMDSSNNIALGFSISSSTMFPSIRYTGRMASDPLGVMTIAERGIFNGGGSQTDPSGRWGDYSAMSSDPTEGSKFWYTNQYYTSNSGANWKTRIASFSFAGILSVSATATPNPVCTGQTTQLDATASGGSGTYTYSWTSLPAGFTSNIQNPTATPTETTTYIVEVSDGANTGIDSLVVDVTTLPVISAGPDTTYCSWVPLFPLYGSASVYSSLLWTTAGDGYFNMDTVATVLYYPGSGDKANGSVTLTMTAQAQLPCTGQSTDDIVILFDPCTGIPAPAAEEYSLTVMPNPSTGLFTMSVLGLDKSPLRISVSGVTGNMVTMKQVVPSASSYSETIDLTAYPKGVYLLRISSDQGTLTQKLVVR